MKRWLLNCKRCELHSQVQSVGLSGHVGLSARLGIFLDHPTLEEDKRHKTGFSDSMRALWWLLEKMSVDKEDVLIDYVLKCFRPDKVARQKAERLACIEGCATHRFALLQMNPVKSLVVMGRIACEAFLNGADLKSKEGCYWQPAEAKVQAIINKLWVTYSPAYIIQSPSESPRLYRVLFRAAEEANLNPKWNPKVKPLDLGK